MGKTDPRIRNLHGIETVVSHNGSTQKKILVSHTEKRHGDIATMNYAWMLPGADMDLHTHTDGEEMYLFLDGSGEIRLGDEWIPVSSGDFVSVPRDTLHGVRNTGRTNLVFITIRTVGAKR